MPLTRSQAHAGALHLERRLEDLDGFIGPFRACLDGCHFVPCTGAAHSNVYIDNCGVCAPRWGVVMVPREFATLGEMRDAREALLDLLIMVRDEAFAMTAVHRAGNSALYHELRAIERQIVEALR
jgi:hypothetical protein